jgi:hypothetical protein
MRVTAGAPVRGNRAGLRGRIPGRVVMPEMERNRLMSSREFAARRAFVGEAAVVTSHWCDSFHQNLFRNQS